jgi:hypothetical protein
MLQDSLFANLPQTARGYHEEKEKPPPSTTEIIPIITTTATTTTTTQSNPGPDDVLQAHNYQGSQVIAEFCDRLLSSHNNIGSKTHAQIQSLIQTAPQIKTWIHDPTSSILILTGGQDPNQTFHGIPFETGKPPLSGISFVTAKLLQEYSCILDDDDDDDDDSGHKDVVFIPLIFFCTLQRRSWQGRLTPRDLAMNLLMQLVDQYRGDGDGDGDGLDLSFSNSSGQMMHSCIYRVDTLRDICARFTELVLEIAARKSNCVGSTTDGTDGTGSSTTTTTTTTTMFIVIDGTHELSMEGGAFHAEYALIFDHLLTLFHLDNNHNHNHNYLTEQKMDRDTDSTSLRMKLLFAGPAGSIFVEQLRMSAKTTVVTLPAEVIEGIQECRV